MRRRVSRPSVKWPLVLGALGSLLFILYWLGSLESRQSRPPTALIELHKCPACYGQSLCSQLLPLTDVTLCSRKLLCPRLVPLTDTRATYLDSWTSLGHGRSGAGVKNVFRALLPSSSSHSSRQQVSVVLKKLAHDDELLLFDQLADTHCAVCSLQERRRHYRQLISTIFPSPVAGNDTQQRHGGPPVSDRSADSRLSLPVHWNTSHLEHFTCLSPRALQWLYDGHSEQPAPDKSLHVATLLLVNVEPLILQAFPQSRGWPFARYLGACGRLVVEQYMGEPLSAFHGASWRQRAGLALQLLEICDILTRGDNDFSLYLTDFSADNLAVNSDGALSLVDLENVIIVDRQHVLRHYAATANVTHISPVLCRNCMGYQPEHLCKHIRSDHNYMAVCRGLLSSTAFDRSMPGGLFHHTPAPLLQIYPQFLPALQLCADPSPITEPITRAASSTLSDVISDLTNQCAAGGGTSELGDCGAFSRIEVVDYLRTLLNRMLSEQWSD